MTRFYLSCSGAHSAATGQGLPGVWMKEQSPLTERFLDVFNRCLRVYAKYVIVGHRGCYLQTQLEQPAEFQCEQRGKLGFKPNSRVMNQILQAKCASCNQEMVHAKKAYVHLVSHLAAE